MVSAKFQNYRSLARLWMSVLVGVLVVLGAGYSVLPVRAHPAESMVAQSEVTVLAVVSNAGSKVLDAPSGATVATLDPGAVVTAFGHTSDSLWIAVRTENGKVGWMKTSDTVVFGVDTLPVVYATTARPRATPATIPLPWTSMATATNTPTLSPTPKPTEPPTATATATQQPAKAEATAPKATATEKAPSASSGASSMTDGMLGIVGGKGATLKSSPTEAAGITLEPGSAVTIVGRDEASDWLRVVNDSGVEGWVSSTEIVAFDLQSLPVVSADAASSEATQGSASEKAPETAQTASAKEPAAPAAQAAVPVTTTQKSEVSVTVQTTGAALRLRSGPGTGYPIIGGVANGSRFAATGRDSSSSWIEVEMTDGSRGWLSASYLSVTGSVADLPVRSPTGKTTAASSPAITASTAPAATPATASQPTQSTPPGGVAGKLVVSSGFGGTFYVYNLQSGVLSPVTNGFDPEISPDGTRVAFTRVGGENGVYVINIDGSNERKLYGGNEMLASPKWNPDGSKIVFNQLTDTGLKTETFESPFDDSVVVVTRQTSTFGLATVKVDNKEYRDLEVEGGGFAPDWNNDNIIYRANRGFKITMDKSGVALKTVTRDTGFQDPDLYGNRIVYQSKSGNHFEIMAMNDDGSGQIFLTRPVTTLVDELPNNVAPAWSPDGKYIVYLSNRGADNSAGPWGIWVMNADGSNQRRLPIDINIKYGYAQEQMVSWGK